jgi:hypothetical protein
MAAEAGKSKLFDLKDQETPDEKSNVSFSLDGKGSLAAQLQRLSHTVKQKKKKDAMVIFIAKYEAGIIGTLAKAASEGKDEVIMDPEHFDVVGLISSREFWEIGVISSLKDWAIKNELKVTLDCINDFANRIRITWVNPQQNLTGNVHD